MIVWVALEVLAGEVTGIEGVFSTEEAAERFARAWSSESRRIHVEAWTVDGERAS